MTRPIDSKLANLRAPNRPMPKATGATPRRRAGSRGAPLTMRSARPRKEDTRSARWKMPLSSSSFCSRSGQREGGRGARSRLGSGSHAGDQHVDSGRAAPLLSRTLSGAWQEATQMKQWQWGIAEHSPGCGWWPKRTTFWSTLTRISLCGAAHGGSTAKRSMGVVMLSPACPSTPPPGAAACQPRRRRAGPPHPQARLVHARDFGAQHILLLPLNEVHRDAPGGQGAQIQG